MKHLYYLTFSFLILSCGSSLDNESPEPLENSMNKHDTTDLEMTANPMKEDQYWKCIDQAIMNTNGEGELLNHLIESLETLPSTEIIGFRLRTDMLLTESYTSELWCAAYIMNGGCSDDGFEYFRCWLIAQGEDLFKAAMKNPDSISGYITQGQDIYELEEFWYVANSAFSNRTGKELYDYIDYDNFNYGESHYVGNDFNWSEDDPESMKAICPNLYAKFMEKL